MDMTEKLHQLRIETWELKGSLWRESFLTPKWWFIALTILISYGVWWRFIDKRRIIELLLFGSYIAVARIIFDTWGITSGRWSYHIDLLPNGISLFLNDLTIVPLAFTLVYQYSHTWTRYLVLSVIAEGIIAFVCLPLFIKIGILTLYNWHAAYSFVFMIITATVMRGVMLIGLLIQKNARLKYPGQALMELIPQPVNKPLDNNTNKDKEKKG